MPTFIHSKAGPGFALRHAMESEGAESGRESKILQAMEATEPSQATAVLSGLMLDLQSYGVEGVNLTGMWCSFKRLLHRRGYFVATDAELAQSLREILAVGEGFDLFDLARCLAEYDAQLMRLRGLPTHLVLTPLKPFAASQTRRKPRKENRDA